MPGFGNNPFGHQPFGQWAWSRRVLYDAIPEVYKQLDTENGNVLQTYSESLRYSFDNLRQDIRDFLDLRDPLLVRTQYDEVETLRLGPVLVPKGTIEQRGLTGFVDAINEFNAPTARFRTTDVGKQLFITGSANPQNNRQVTVATIISPTVILTSPLLIEDAGPLRWELRTAVPAPTDYITVEVRAGDISTITPNWLLFDGFANFTVLARRQFKVPVDENQYLTEQEGSDGAIDNLGRFAAASATIDQTIVGKHLTISGSQFPSNNGKFEILQVVQISPGDNVAVLDADPILLQDEDLVWAILPYGELDLVGTVPPAGVIDQEGSDLTVTVINSATSATVVAPSAAFTSGDVGKILSLRGSLTTPSNDGSYVVASVLSPSSVNITTTTSLHLETSNSLTWELRTATLVGDTTQVAVNAPSLIADLSQDFGITIDTLDDEARQRSWVANITQWIDLKGTPDGYRIIGAISGFDITSFQLYRVSADIFVSIPSADAFEVGDPNPGRSGSNGTLSEVSHVFQLSSPTALFVNSDVGLVVSITGAAVGGNNQFATIAAVISPTAIQFTTEDSFTLPDSNNGALGWAIVRLYSDLPPLQPLYDQVNNDLLEDIVETISGGFLTYRADMYCWAPTFSTTIDVNVLSATTLGPGIQQVSVTGPSEFATAPEVVLQIGNWQFLSLTTVSSSSTGNLISGAAPSMTLTDPSAVFADAEVGMWIQIAGATTPHNDGVFLIEAVSTSVQYFNGRGVAEAFAGTYTIFSELDIFIETLPVLTPALAAGFVTATGTSFTQVGNVTTLTSTAALFTSSMVGRHILIAGALSAGNDGIFVVTAFISSTQISYKNPNGVAESFSGTWKVGLGIYTFNIAVPTLPPTAVPGKFRYICPVNLTCDYCGSNRVLVVIQPTAELLAEGGLFVERLLERVLIRLAEVTPAHVTLIIDYEVTLPASLIVSAAVIPP